MRMPASTSGAARRSWRQSEVEGPGQGGKRQPERRGDSGETKGVPQGKPSSKGRPATEPENCTRGLCEPGSANRVQRTGFCGGGAGSSRSSANAQCLHRRGSALIMWGGLYRAAAYRADADPGQFASLLSAFPGDAAPTRLCVPRCLASYIFGVLYLWRFTFLRLARAALRRRRHCLRRGFPRLRRRLPMARRSRRRIRNVSFAMFLSKSFCWSRVLLLRKIGGEWAGAARLARATAAAALRGGNHILMRRFSDGIPDKMESMAQHP